MGDLSDSEKKVLLPENQDHDGYQTASEVYTVDEGINEIGFGAFQIFITISLGLTRVMESSQIMLLQILSAEVQCQWDLNHVDEATITTAIFIGYLLGGLFWGVVLDMIGRKNGIFLLDLVILVFGVLSSLKLSSDDSKVPGYPWLLACRFGVGFGAGGASQVITYYTEFLPRKLRGAITMLFELWYAAGIIFGAVLAIAVMSEGGLDWHWYLGLVCTPLIPVFIAFPLLPESARFYLAKGKDDKAQKVMARIAWFNCTQVPPGRVVSNEEKERSLLSDMIDSDITDKKESVHLEPIPLDSDQLEPNERDNKTNHLASWIKGGIMNLSPLFSNGQWKTTILLVFLWLGIGWLYFGAAMLAISLLQYEAHCVSGNETRNVLINESTSDCNLLDTSDYIKILWISAAEIPGTLVTVVLIEVLGRKITMAVESIVVAIGFLLLFICVSDIILTIFLFVIRVLVTGITSSIFLYTVEVYPTTFRGFGLGVGTSACRVGAIVAPYVAQVLLSVNDYATISLYAGSSLVIAVLAMLLPIETKGRALHDS